MERQVLDLLRQTLSGDGSIRNEAERQLRQLHTEEAFPEALAAIAQHREVATECRQAALLTLKRVVQKSWSTALDEFEGPYVIPDDVRSRVRKTTLNIATGTGEDTKIVAAASYVVSKIASADYPEQWPDLLPQLLTMLPAAEPQQLHSVLVVLSDLVDEGFDEEQFASSAVKLVSGVHAIAVSESKALLTRALSVSVFRSCLDTMEVVLQTEGEAVQQFVQEAAVLWVPFFHQTLLRPLPATSGPKKDWQGQIALKTQAVKALDKLHTIFPHSLAGQTTDIFGALLNALRTHLDPFLHFYTGDQQQEVQEDNADRLPVTLDVLVLEELDYMQTLLNSSALKQKMSDSAMQQLAWIVVGYAHVSAEDLNVWEFDVNSYVAEEATETAQYSARNASAELAVKISRNKMPLLQSLLETETSSDKGREAVLYLATSVLEGFRTLDTVVDANTLQKYLDLSHEAMTSEFDLLRARGYTTAAYLITAPGSHLVSLAPEHATRAVGIVQAKDFELSSVSAMKAVQLYAKVLPRNMAASFQDQAVAAISTFLSTRDLSELGDSEDLLAALVSTLRDILSTNPSLCLSHSAMDVLLTLASYGAKSWHVTDIITEAFESAVVAMANSQAFTQFCAKILPNLTNALETGADTALSDIAASLLAVLAEHGPAPLPSGFVDAVVPKLYRLLFVDLDFAVHQAATVTLKHILSHDAQQLFEWTDPTTNKGGLEILLMIIDRLLGPDVQESSAAEVGGLAVELVEKAGADRLGPFLLQLLTVVAIRLGTAERADLVQDLVLVFARLALTNAQDVLDFLAQVSIDGKETGLDLVMRKWLDNSINFSGYEAIKQNVVALSNIYRLHDARLAAIQTKGDLIVDDQSRIKTRSQARNRPDQYHLVSVPLKIIKVLVQELIIAPSSTEATSGMARFAADSADDDDDEWEDETAVMDLGSASTRQDLMSFMDSMHEFKLHQADDATQQYLVDFFKQISQDSQFRQLYHSLTDVEQEKLGKTQH